MAEPLSLDPKVNGLLKSRTQNFVVSIGRQNGGFSFTHLNPFLARLGDLYSFNFSLRRPSGTLDDFNRHTNYLINS